MNGRILLVEDEAGVALVVTDLLRANGYSVEACPSGPEGLQRALEERFDLLILDLMLPGLDGFGICRGVRERGFDGGILFLTAMGQLQERVLGLRTGADDYLVKPFDPEELLARVLAILRRVRAEALTPVTRVEIGATTADFTRMEFTRGGRRLDLTTKEGELLRFLVNHRDQLLTRGRILGTVWRDQPHITERTVDVHVAWLRQKLEATPQAPRHILTVRGEGYRFRLGA